MIGSFFRAGLILVLLSCPAMALPLQLTGITPSDAVPDCIVTVTGGPFPPSTRVVFGELLLTPVHIEEKRLTFSVPQLPAGDYLLQLRSGEEVSKQNLYFQVLAPVPAILSLSPRRIDSCDLGNGKKVTVQARGLQSGTLLMLDGVELATDRTARDALTFTVPTLAAGLHQVHLVNPDGPLSQPAALLVDSAPRIETVVPGETSVTSYQLVISGKNFSYRSVLLVDGQQFATIPLPPPAVEGQEVTFFTPKQAPIETLQYVDCHTLIHIRRPSSSQPKTFSLEVVNPDGQTSEVYSYTGP